MANNDLTQPKMAASGLNVYKTLKELKQMMTEMALKRLKLSVLMGFIFLLL